ncbi:MAG: hypothetical protein IAE82_02815 [Opitutaceae bacterium]|nr:hypothetical protein [Opitutaceae bacterium]
MADSHVAVRAFADEAYIARKFGPDGPKLETYVFLEGRYYPGATVDRSLSRMPFRSIAEMLARDLARQNYRPAKELKSADLLILVHWGTTLPNTGINEMTARTYVGASPEQAAAAQERSLNAQFNVTTESPDADPATQGLDDFTSTDDMWGDVHFNAMENMNERIAADMNSKSNAELLGYRSDLSRYNSSAFTREEERTLRLDLSTERYFIIMKAFDLKTLGKDAKPVWTVYLNTRSPGINFATAVGRLGHAGSRYFGLQNDRVTSVRTKDPTGTVTIEPAIILGFEE